VDYKYSLVYIDNYLKKVYKKMSQQLRLDRWVVNNYDPWANIR
jgi:hypothetical protein